MLVEGDEVLVREGRALVQCVIAQTFGIPGGWMGTHPFLAACTCANGRMFLALNNMTDETEGRIWCRGHDLNSPQAHALQVALALS